MNVMPKRFLPVASLVRDTQHDRYADDRWYAKRSQNGRLSLPMRRGKGTAQRGDKLNGSKGHVEEDCCERTKAKALDYQWAECANATRWNRHRRQH